ncbi:MAG: hypothetical protein JO140_02540 [Candidatus Eremiobacteraeota bacterium]|nr:hypothetical protein [Candidatus Eremiobacteraeota bacterium]
MKKIFAAVVILAASLAGCGGGGGSSSPAPTATPTIAPSPLVVTYVNIPYQPSPYPTSAAQVFFPFTGAPFAVTVQANGGTPGYKSSNASNCGTGGNSNATVTPVGTNQFTITPTVSGVACVITFSDSATPPQNFLVTIFVNGGSAGP